MLDIFSNELYESGTGDGGFAYFLTSDEKVLHEDSLASEDPAFMSYSKTGYIFFGAVRSIA